VKLKKKKKRRKEKIKDDLKGFARFWSDDIIAVVVENAFDLVSRTWNQIRAKLKIPQRGCEVF